MNKSFLSAALFLALGAIASTGCAVQTGTESEIGTNESAINSKASSDTDTTGNATDTDVTAMKGKGGGGIPSNCTPNGGHDPAGGKIYYCKDAQGYLHLCDEGMIKTKAPGCTAALQVWWDPAAVEKDAVQLQP